MLKVNKIAEVIGLRFVITTDEVGPIAALLTNLQAADDPAPDSAWTLELIIGVGKCGRRVSIDLPPLLSRSIARDWPAILGTVQGSRSLLSYFQNRLFLSAVPGDAREHDELLQAVRKAVEDELYLVPEDRPSPSALPTNYPQDRPTASLADRSGPQTARQMFEELVMRWRGNEPGLITTYLECYPEINRELIPAQDAALLVLSIYRVDVLDLLAREGYYDEIYVRDLEAAFSPYERAWRIRDETNPHLRAYRETGVLPKVPTQNAWLLRKTTPPAIASPHRSWADVLGLSGSASLEEIRAAYRRKIAQYHPDRVADLGPELQALAEKHAKEINRAYREAQEQRTRA